MGFGLRFRDRNLGGTRSRARAVDSVPFFEGDALNRVLAHIDVSFSNSMIEAWWRSLKHQWLFLRQLDNIATVKKLVEFYVAEHNTVMPHSAFHGRSAVASRKVSNVWRHSWASKSGSKSGPPSL